MRTATLLVSLALLFGGCASFDGKPRTVILKHPETLDFVNCNVDKWGTEKSYQKNEQCIADYEKKGYVIWGSRR